MDQADADRGNLPTAPLTRAQRRALRETGPAVVPESARVVRLPVVVTSALVAGLFILSAAAEPTILAAAFAWACLVMAWAWPSTIGATPGYVVAFPIGLAGVLSATAVALTNTTPYLILAPIAVAIGAVLAFLLQLTRRDGRAGLTASLTAAASGLAFVVLGVCLLPIAHAPLGAAVITAAMTGTILSLSADFLLAKASLGAWLLPVAMLLGGVGGGAISALGGDMDFWVGVLLGLASAALAHIVRRLLSALPMSEGSKAQVGIGCAAVLATGIVVHVVGSIFVG